MKSFSLLSIFFSCSSFSFDLRRRKDDVVPIFFPLLLFFVIIFFNVFSFLIKFRAFLFVNTLPRKQVRKGEK